MHLAPRLLITIILRRISRIYRNLQRFISRNLRSTVCRNRWILPDLPLDLFRLYCYSATPKFQQLFAPTSEHPPGAVSLRESLSLQEESHLRTNLSRSTYFTSYSFVQHKYMHAWMVMKKVLSSSLTDPKRQRDRDDHPEPTPSKKSR